MAIFSPYSSTVLTVKQFPLLFNDADRQEFLEHFGAVRICCLKRYKNASNIIVADFSSPAQASQALVRLHQLELLCRRLIVEYCPLELVQYVFSNCPSTKPHHEVESDRIHGISPGANQIYYALPSERLCYNYPPIDESILSNINDALWSVPAFYTQVLHLMNKMSLPCPMVINSIKKYRTSSLNNVGCQTDESMSSDFIDMDTDEDESEIDDGEEERRIRSIRQNRKRLPLAQPKGRSIVPSIEIDMTIDTSFQKKPSIEFRVPSTLNLAEFASTSTITFDESGHGFGRIEPIETSVSKTSDRLSENLIEPLPPLPQVPTEEIMKNRLNEEQLKLFDNGQLYRNYERGVPSQRLYIKNLNVKMVDERVLHSIYDRYSQSSVPVDIHLLREGKMKGQAFVTLPSENLATRALNETNGYVLHEKPMIVQFARSAKPKDSL